MTTTTIKMMPFLELGDPRKPVIVLLAGFPDDCTSGWSMKLLTELKRDYFCISICFPGFDHRDTGRKWGYDFPELVDLLHETIQSRFKEYGIPSSNSFYLLLHDWGSHLGQCYENKHPTLVKKVCMLDAGNMKDVPNSIYLSYRFLFGWSYWVSQTYSLLLGMICFRLSLVCMVLLPFIGPTKHEKAPRKVSDLHVDMCYPFYYTTIMNFHGKGRPLPTVPSCPVLFIYGEKKNLMLHGPHFLQDLDKKSDGSKHISLPKSGHWPSHAEPDIVLENIRSFFK